MKKVYRVVKQNGGLSTELVLISSKTKALEYIKSCINYKEGSKDFASFKRGEGSDYYFPNFCYDASKTLNKKELLNWNYTSAKNGRYSYKVIEVEVE